MEEQRVASGVGSERPLSEGAASAGVGSANAPANRSVLVKSQRQSRATNGGDIANASRVEEAPIGDAYGTERPGKNILLLVTFGLAVIGWLVTLISQAIVAATVNNELVRILWFGFIVQTYITFLVFGVMIGFFTIYDYGMQIAILSSLATGFAVLGVDRTIYDSEASLQANGAGWLIIAIVDLLWILYFTSPSHSPLVRFANSAAGPQAPPRIPVEKIARSTDAFAMGAMHGGTQHGGSARVSLGPSVQPDQKPVTASGRWSGTNGRNTLGSIPGSEPLEGKAATAGVPSIHLDQASAPDENQRESKAVSSLPDAAAVARARAMYDYKGSEKDVNELSFKKGDMFFVYDTTSKWWEVKTEDGRKGIAPSNYLHMLP